MKQTACETGKEPIQHLCNVPKFSDKENFAGIHLKFKNRGQNFIGISFVY